MQHAPMGCEQKKVGSEVWMIPRKKAFFFIFSQNDPNNPKVNNLWSEFLHQQRALKHPTTWQYQQSLLWGTQQRFRT
jgi:hypothetical protein